MKIDEMLKYKVRRYLYQVGQESHANKQKNDRDSKLVEKVQQTEESKVQVKEPQLNKEKYYDYYNQPNNFNYNAYYSYPTNNTYQDNYNKDYNSSYNKNYHNYINEDNNYNLYVKGNQPEYYNTYGPYSHSTNQYKEAEYYDVYIDQPNNVYTPIQNQYNYEEGKSNYAISKPSKGGGVMDKLEEIEAYLEEKMSGIKKSKR